jgi:N-acetylneuraminic acid mutarotase
MKRLISIVTTLCLALGLLVVNVWAAEEGWQIETTMPTSMPAGNSGDYSMVTIGEKIYTLGVKEIAINEIYNIKTESWETGAPNPISIKKGSCAVVQDKIYLIGATDTYTINMQIYDTSTNTWTSTNEGIPTITVNYSKQFSAISVGNKVYLIVNNAESNQSNLYIFDTQTGAWQSGKGLPYSNIDSAGVVATGENIYVIGGRSSTPLSTVHIYNTETDTWSRGTNMLNPRSHVSATTYGNKVYVIGGYDKGAVSNKVESYDINTNTWKEEIPFSEYREQPLASSGNGKIYVLGGPSSRTMESLQVGNERKLSILLNVGENAQLSISNDLADNASMTWTSSDSAVATVDANGKVTAIGVGTCDISAQNTDGTWKESIPVRVFAGTADLHRLAVHLNPGQNAKLYLTENPEDTTWNSLDTSVATVDANGKVTAVAQGIVIMEGTANGETHQVYVRVRA